MESFLARPKTAIQGLLEANTEFRERAAGARPSHELPKSRLRELIEISDKLPTCVAALSQSLYLIEVTSLDVVDMETRMQNESRRLADLLDELGEKVRQQFFIKKYFEDQLIALEEQANALAAGLFPSGVQGLNMVNSKLWEFTNLQMIIYRDTLARVRSRLSSEQQKNVKSRFTELREPFDTLNQFLNDLALRALDGDSVETRFEYVEGRLSEARNLIRASLKQPEFSEFKTILKASSQIADSLRELLRSVRVPVFPPHEDLEELSASIDEDLYGNLTGLQAFALLNIAARMRSIELPGKLHMLSPEFGVRVFSVFPDRIYFRARPALVDAVRSCGMFAPAAAALHKFRAGSYKQNVFAKGNLQVSYSNVQDGMLNVDADIDLYRDPLAHLFGEVLHNHLTGRKTDAYKVRGILDEHEVVPIGGFSIFSI